MNEKVITIRKIKNPLISVIIPTLNEEKYLEKTLISVKNQTTNFNYEIIVSDSKSRDKTVEIAKKYADMIVISNKHGISVGRNLGAKYAKGEILLFLDADTLILPNTLSEISKVFKKNKNVVAVTCPLIPISWKMNDFLVYWSYDLLLRFLFRTGKMIMPGTFIGCKTNFFKKIGGFNEKIKYVGEDTDFAVRISKFGKIKLMKNLVVFTSPRRIEKWGSFGSIFKYSFLYLYHFISKKGVSEKTFPPVR